jgi:hypothetical protein
MSSDQTKLDATCNLIHTCTACRCKSGCQSSPVVPSRRVDLDHLTGHPLDTHWTSSGHSLDTWFKMLLARIVSSTSVPRLALRTMATVDCIRSASFPLRKSFLHMLDDRSLASISGSCRRRTILNRAHVGCSVTSVLPEELARNIHLSARDIASMRSRSIRPRFRVELTAD